MTDKKISENSALLGSVLDATVDLFPVSDMSVPATKNITLSEISKALAVLLANSDASIIGSHPVWVKVGSALPYTTFQTAATTISVTLFSLISAGVVHAVKLKTSTAFVGTSISALTVRIGIIGNTDKYMSDFNLLSAVTGTNFDLTSAIGTESHTAATDIKITLDSTGANLSALTAGTVDVWALLSVAK